MLDFKLLKPTRQRHNLKNIFGFDIETYNKNRNFYCASIYSDNPKFCKTLFSKDDVIDYFKKKHIFYNSVIAATNLGFDFLGVFFDKEDMSHFKLLWRGSDLITASTYVKKKKFYYSYDKKAYKLSFIDTLNYAKLSVNELGKLLNVPKIDKPDFLGNKPKNLKQKKELIRYNMRDSEISQKAIMFLYNTFHKLGATPKLTIASTSMSLFRNKYLDRAIFRHSQDILAEQFKGYFGGRVEAAKRGFFKDYNYYDFNSLYPSVMLNSYPEPNSLRISRENTIRYIENFDGMSKVLLEAPYMKFPLLPYRYDNKLLFPYGEFSGYYTHIELREAIRLGYLIKKVYKSFYYTEECFPFYDYVIDLYRLRLKYKKEHNPMEQVVKLLLNSLYGKFGQKFLDKDCWIPIPDSWEDFSKIKNIVETKKGFIRIKQDLEPSVFCIPIWASYVTAYGRILLHNYITQAEPIYYDTDSLITKKNYESNNLLGKLKLEEKIRYGVIVKPKFYGFVTDDFKEKVVIKGLGVKMSYDDFLNFIENPKITYEKFTKFKESLRRNFTPNEIHEITKELSLEDEKRKWKELFNFKTLEDSEPLRMVKGISELTANIY